jgi:hypothetical protein
VVVIFWQRGLFGKTELTWDRIFGFPERLRMRRAAKRKKAEEKAALKKAAEGGER